MRLIVRRVRPSRRQMKNLTAFEIKTGWRYSTTATNIRHMSGISGSQHAQWLDVLHRSHAVVEDRVRCDKARGLRNLPSQSWTVNRGWMLAANLAADVEAWTRLLGLHDVDGLADAEPDTALQTSASARPPGPPRPLTGPEDPRHLALAHRVHHLLATPLRTSGRHLTSGPVPTKTRTEENHTSPGPWNPAQPQRHATNPPHTRRDKRGELTTSRGSDHRSRIEVDSIT
ncbi:hypothetical protein ACFVHS_42890 [Streptomyces sp. NPDC057746]|uniref:hypothetical protein n=1 Tax=Streptomyces sp. NPDC057746 TaxID=3346237 RepID=UPI0036ABB733